MVVVSDMMFKLKILNLTNLLIYEKNNFGVCDIVISSTFMQSKEIEKERIQSIVFILIHLVMQTMSNYQLIYFH